MIEKEYIGDGVYIQPGNYKGCVILTCENGIETYERIHLEPDMVKNIMNYVEKMKKRQGE